MGDDKDIFYSAAFMGFGVWSFFKGFKRLRRKRLIENIPTSTIRGLALGLVELCGKAAKTVPLKSPITKTDCVLYKYLVEEYRKSGKSGHWVKIASGDSFYCPFWLVDSTGRILVFPQRAELELPRDYQFSARLGSAWPDNIIEFAREQGISYQAWLGKRRLRFSEWHIKENESVYVIGTADKSDEGANDSREKLIQRIQQLKEDPQKMQEVDTNKDSRISEEEWDRAVGKIELDLAQELLKSAAQPVENAADLIITKGEEESMYLISDCSEESLLKKLYWQSVLGIYGGALLSLAMLAYLLFRLSWH